MSIIKRIKRWFGRSKEDIIADSSKSANVDKSNIASDNYLGFDASGRPFNELENTLRVSRNLMEMYRDYEEMDHYPEIATALDLYAEDATIPNSLSGKTIWADSKNVTVKNIIMDLFHRILKIEDDIFGLTRVLAKYGNVFAEIIVSEEDGGVIGLNYLDTPTMRRVEDDNGKLLGYIQDPRGRFEVKKDEVIKKLKSSERRGEIERCILFAPWEVVHWRLRYKYLKSPYGHSILDAARWIWKRLLILEDTALVFKLTRSPGRYVFYVDVGNLPPKEAFAYMNKIKRQINKKKLINQSTGQIDFRFNPMSPHEDIYLPVAADKENTRVDVLSGPESELMDDVDYFRQKLITALKVPRKYLGLEDESLERSLAQEDVRFGRSAMRLQRDVRNGFHHIIRVHFASLDIDPDRLEYEVKMTVPSYIYELSQIEVMNARADLARNLEELFPKEWIIQRVFQLSLDDAKDVIKGRKDQDIKTVVDTAHVQAKLDKEYPTVDDQELEVATKESDTSIDINDIDKKLEKLSRSSDGVLRLAKRTARDLFELKSTESKISKKLKELVRSRQRGVSGQEFQQKRAIRG